MIGYWINCVLLTIEVFVAWIYVSKYYGQLKRPTKLVISTMLCNDITLSTVAAAALYLVCYLAALSPLHIITRAPRG